MYIKNAFISYIPFVCLTLFYSGYSYSRVPSKGGGGRSKEGSPCNLKGGEKISALSSSPCQGTTKGPLLKNGNLAKAPMASPHMERSGKTNHFRVYF